DHTFRRRLGSFLAKRSALLQICSNPVGLLKEYSETPSKLCALDDLLEDLIRRNGEKVVIWSFYTASLNAIVHRYGLFNPARYDGSITDVGERRNAVRKFQEDDTTMLFVGNPAAAGAGLTLHRARFAIYESMSNQAAHYLQSLDRIHRRGQKRRVEYLILLCDGTIEVQEYARLTGKERAAQLLFKDQVDAPITREAMLAEAVAAGKFLRTFI
ncbi:MAG: helicase-related protein, partial [Pyrinomonadaceae bacterium]